MHSLIEDNKELINKLCKQHYIKSLYVFGSITTDRFNMDSDIDFLYTIDIDRFPDWITGAYDYTDNLLHFEKELKNLFKRNIDLIPDLPMQNKYFKGMVEQTRKMVYAA